MLSLPSRLLVWSVLLVGLLAGQAAVAQAKPMKLLRFPTVSRTHVAFSYAGDLYLAPRTGGTARKLTAHQGMEIFARFSPDGKQLAFSGQYDGNTEVYLLPLEGGHPKRLTYTASLRRDDVAERMGPNNITLTWTPDGKGVVYRSRRYTFNDFKGHLFVAPLDGGLSQQLPFSVAGFCSYSPDGKRMAYNRVFREFRTWKYYQGGQADDIWLHDFKTGEARNLTQNPAQDLMPMWHGDKIFFISDRNRTMNLFEHDLSTGRTRQVTSFTEYDVKFPSLGPDAIVYENGGELWIYDIAADENRKITIDIEDDFQYGRPVRVEAHKYVDNVDLHPNGKRLLVTARGDLFNVPVEEGVTYNLTRTSGVHERDAAFSPDGKWMAYISDATQEDELYIRPVDGSAPPTQLTDKASTYKYSFRWSPDSKHLAWSDKKLRLRVVNVETKKIAEVDQAERWEIRDFTWAPDGQWLAYTRPEWQTESRLMLWNANSGETRPLTESWYAANSPAFSPDGKYIYFASARTFNPIYSRTEWNHAYADMEKLYMLPLTREAENPLRPTNPGMPEADKEEDQKADKATKKDDKSGKDADSAKKDAAVTVSVDWTDLAQRVVELPVSAGYYFNLLPTKGGLYYNHGSRATQGSHLMYYDLEAKEETDFGKAMGLQLTPDGKTMLVGQPGPKMRYHVVPAPKGKLALEKPVDLGNMICHVNRAEEWKQIYTECWRQMKYFFYDPGMHGVDWDAVYDKYAALLPYVNNRADLTYLIGEVIGELNVGHAYINGGDREYAEIERVSMGLLGAEFSKDKSGYIRIDTIYHGNNWHETERSPLTEHGSGIRAGGYILAVNGRSVRDVTNFHELLIDQANETVELSINREPSEDGAHTVLVKPLASEADLRYRAWVNSRIEAVERLSNGRIGYLHIPDMGPEGLNEWAKHFYPQLNKEALIVDVRGNGGGNVSPMIIERLRRELDQIQMARNLKPYPSPNQMVLGPLACLVDPFTASDGDLFTWRFKHYNLGKVIGQRSWGGTVGIRGSLPLIDGADLRKPEFSRYDKEGKEWIIEGYGVDPDIVVLNDPHQEYLGNDAQLKKAVEVLMQQLDNKPGIQLPEPPPFPER